MYKHPTIFPALMIVIAQSALAQGGAEVVSTLSVKRIASNAEGKEMAGPATSAKPGDVLEYIADYRNRGKSAATGLAATMPIPAGTEYIADSARPVAGLASTDGVTFAPVPLMRKVKQDDGKVIELAVPYADYRFLRWAARDLGPGRNLVYSTRVMLVSGAATGAALAKK
jgi:uncharacterized repeat protein (TIGR01451 family)